MQSYKRGSHTVWDCKYHLVWVTKYRYPVLASDVGQRTRTLLREIAISHEMLIHAGSINRDHVHMLISIPATAVCVAGGSISEREEFAQAVVGVSRAAQALLGPASWARGYWVATSGNVTDEVGMKYIEDQKPYEPDDHFKVV